MPPLETARHVIINTGNILSLNDITRKSGLNPTEELTEAINITIKEAKVQNGAQVVISRPSDDLASKMSEQPLSNLKIGLKIFLNSDNKAHVKEAIEQGFKALNVSSVHNLIISYKKSLSEHIDDITSLKHIYSILEDYVKQDKICQIGLADVEEQTFKNIFEWAVVKPNIVQINLASCCVVPPTLQAFCKDKEVQLLTHSDPADILPKDVVEGALGEGLPLQWILRFLVHIKCRGVLITKGDTEIDLADVEEHTFKNIFEWAVVKPNIVQINLASCCVVPPTLQAFCKDKEVQLLTHSDPADILPKDVVEGALGEGLPLRWILRFLVHIKCRGVLITKGYLVSLGED